MGATTTRKTRRAAPKAPNLNAKTPIERLQDEIRSAERKLEKLKEHAWKARAEANFTKEYDVTERALILQSEIKGMRAELEEMQAPVQPAETPVQPAETPVQPAETPVQPAETPEQVRAARNLEAAREEARVMGMSFEDACASMGIDPQTGRPVEQEEKSGYAGPMLALRRRLKAGAYQKAANGQPCCGDAIAVLCGQYNREVVVKALIAALGLGSNPYAHLNPGQQSMNLRNKARAAVKNGTLEIAKIEAALIEASKG